MVDSASVAALGNVLLSDCFSDAAGRYWLCTARGLFVVEVRPNSFRHYLDKIQLPTPTTMGNQARGICETMPASTWAALWGGVYKFDNATGGIISHIAGRNPTVLYRDNLHLWAAMRDSLIDIDGSATTVPLPGKLGPENEIWALYRAGKKLYAGTIRGIWDITGTPLEWQLIPGGASTDGWCYGFFCGRDGSLWAATNNGLLKIKSDHITDRYAADAPDSAHTLPCTDIHYVYEDPTGDLWLCTAGDGLVHWQRSSNTYAKYTVADGLSSNTIHALLADEQGYFWMSSDKGLMRFDPRSKAVRIYTVKDGLPDNEFNRLSVFKAADGHMYFGGVNGLVSFNPGELNGLKGQSKNAPIRVSALHHYNIKAGQIEDKTAELLRSNTIEILPGDGLYTLDFQLLDFEQHRHAYAYKIAGMEERWNYITESSLRLGNLPYGNYTLLVKGQNSRGEWSTGMLAIALHVVRPFYLRLWFIIITIAASVCIVWAGIRRRERRLLSANEQLENTVQQRTGQLAQMLREKDVLMKEIHHRVKNNLQVISSLQQMQASRSSDPAVRAALEDSQNRVLSIAFIHQNLYQHDDLKGVEMQSFMQELTGHVLEVCGDKEKQISIEQDVAPITLDIDTAVPIGLILNELLTNSCKHAFHGRRQGHIAITLQQVTEGNYKLEYRDDGPGLNAGIDITRAGSLGLRLISRLAEQLDGILTYPNAPANHVVLAFKDFETRNLD